GSLLRSDSVGAQLLAPTVDFGRTVDHEAEVLEAAPCWNGALRETQEIAAGVEPDRVALGERDLESEHARVEGARARQIGHGEIQVLDALPAQRLGDLAVEALTLLRGPQTPQRPRCRRRRRRARPGRSGARPRRRSLRRPARG